MPALISNNVTLYEATHSQTAVRYGIDNTPPPEALYRMRLVASRCFEPARLHFGCPIAVTSFYRCPELNRRVGGSPTSQHMLGEAMDLDADIHGGLTNKELYAFLAGREFDQLIWEFGDSRSPAWVHVSYRAGTNRNLQLRARREKRWGRWRTIYEPWAP